MKLFSVAVFLFFCFSAAKAQKFVGARADIHLAGTGASVTSTGGAGGNITGTATIKTGFALTQFLMDFKKNNLVLMQEFSFGYGSNQYRISNQGFTIQGYNMRLRGLVGKSLLNKILLLHAGADAGYDLTSDKTAYSDFKLQKTGSSKFSVGGVAGIQLSYGKAFVLGRYHYNFLQSKYSYKRSSGASPEVITAKPAQGYFVLGLGLNVGRQ
jgi:hypothetical protein